MFGCFGFGHPHRTAVLQTAQSEQSDQTHRPYLIQCCAHTASIRNGTVNHGA